VGGVLYEPAKGLLMKQGSKRGVSMNHNEVLLEREVATGHNGAPARGVSMNHNEVLLEGEIATGRNGAPARGVVLNHNEVLL
jgi:protease II